MEYKKSRRRGGLELAARNCIKAKSRLAMLNGLRGMTWAYAVLHHTGLSASTASKKFTPDCPLNLDAAGNPVISNIFYQYLRGERAPTMGPRGKADFDLVAAVNKDPDGQKATRWLTHPLWEVLHPDITLERIRKIMRSMPTEISELLFATFDKNVVYSRYPVDRTPVNEIFALATFDSYIAIVALMREGDLLRDRYLSGAAYHAWVMAYPVANADPVFRYVVQPFCEYICKFGIGNHYMEAET